jgi:predicted  nucleic acid-binding Zn-ribbon protein
MDDFEQFYNDVEQLLYKYKFSRRGNKDLIDVVEDIFSKCNDFEIELSDVKDELHDHEEKIDDLKSDLEALEIDYDSILEENKNLEEKVEIYRQALIDNNLVEYLI